MVQAQINVKSEKITETETQRLDRIVKNGRTRNGYLFLRCKSEGNQSIQTTCRITNPRPNTSRHCSIFRRLLFETRADKSHDIPKFSGRISPGRRPSKSGTSTPPRAAPAPKIRVREPAETAPALSTPRRPRHAPLLVRTERISHKRHRQQGGLISRRPWP